MSDTLWQNTYNALNSLNFEEQLGYWHAVSDELFYEVVNIPLHSLPIHVVIDAQVVEEYIYLGPYDGQFYRPGAHQERRVDTTNELEPPTVRDATRRCPTVYPSFIPERP